jgi:NADPH-dependent curcumin reductase CurA
MIASYNDPNPASFRFVMRIIAARIRLKGFIVFDFQSRMDEFYREMGQLVASGAVKAQETVVEGLENTPGAFLGLFEGANTGKMLVKL